jgi:hypothetical protein
VGRKAIGPVIMGGRVARQMDTLNTRARSFLERMGFFYSPEVMNYEIIVLFWYVQRVCSLLSILYFCPFMGSSMDNISCIVLGHGGRNGSYPCKRKD